MEGLDVSDEPGFAFASIIRTASDYYNTVVDAGFRVERMLEPDPRPVDTDNPRNWLWDQTPSFLETFPSTLIFKCCKA